MLALIAGGLALFLFGLELMTAGLKAVAGSGLQTALAKLTADRFRGLLAGAFVPARGRKAKEDHEPLYLDDSALAAPSLAQAPPVRRRRLALH
jgi:Na+/phosphate symporter